MKYERIFLSIIFPLTYLISMLLMFHGFSEALTIIMILPAFAAIVSILIEFKSISELLKPFFQKISFKGFTFAIAFPLTAILFCMLVAIFSNQGALSTSWNTVLIKIGSLILISIVLFVIGLFQEYGWRGYLLPRLIQRYTLKKANFLLGIIIVCYHIPVIFILNLHYGIAKATMYTILQSSAIFAMNYAFSYLFTLSQNVILPSIMLTLWNNLNLAILGYSYKLLPVDGYVIGRPHTINGEGLLGLIFFSMFAIYAYRKFPKHII